MPRINFEQRIHNGKVAVDIAHPNNVSRGRVAFLLPELVEIPIRPTLELQLALGNRLLDCCDPFERFR